MLIGTLLMLSSRRVAVTTISSSPPAGGRSGGRRRGGGVGRIRLVGQQRRAAASRAVAHKVLENNKCRRAGPVIAFERVASIVVPAICYMVR